MMTLKEMVEHLCEVHGWPNITEEDADEFHQRLHPGAYLHGGHRHAHDRNGDVA